VSDFLPFGDDKEAQQQGCGALLPWNLSCGKPRKRIELLPERNEDYEL
jgi:hypothetical protein